jgi:hypothetical protein
MLISTAAATALGLGVAGLTLAQEGSYQSAELVLEQPEPDRVTPLRIAIDYADPANPSGKPHAVSKVVETLPPGSRIDTSAPEVCSASDAEFATRGTAACPPDSRVGGGEVDLDTGGATLSFDVTQFNNRDQLILLFEQKGGGIRTPSRAEVQGDRPAGPRIIATVPPIPGGPPDGFTAIKRGRLRLDAVTRAGKNYITTPPSCPAAGGWTSRIDFTYRNGTEQAVTTRSPCSASPGQDSDRSPPRIFIRGMPAGCASDGFRLRVRIRDRSSLRRAGVRLDGRLVRTTGRKRFRLKVPVRGLAEGRHRIAVAARDERGNRARKSVRFRRC